MIDTSLFVTAIVTMGTAIGGMFAWFQKQFGKLELKLKDCEDDREKLWEKIAELSGDASLVHTCPAPRCPIRLSFPHRPVAPRQLPEHGA